MGLESGFKAVNGFVGAARGLAEGAKNLVGAGLKVAVVPTAAFLWLVKERAYTPQGVAMKFLMKPAQKFVQKRMAGKEAGQGAAPGAAADAGHH